MEYWKLMFKKKQKQYTPKQNGYNYKEWTYIVFTVDHENSITKQSKDKKERKMV